MFWMKKFVFCLVSIARYQRTDPFSRNAEINNRTNFVRFPFQWHNKYMLNRTSSAYFFCTWSAHSPHNLIFSSFSPHPPWTFSLSRANNRFGVNETNALLLKHSITNERYMVSVHFSAFVKRSRTFWCEFYLFTFIRCVDDGFSFFLVLSLFASDSFCTYFLGMNDESMTLEHFSAGVDLLNYLFVGIVFTKTSLRVSRVSLIPFLLFISYSPLSAQTPGTTE